MIDKRLTPRWMAYEWADTAIGSVVVIVGAAALIVIPAFAFAHTHIAGAFVDAGATASALSHRIGRLAGALFAIVLLDSSLLGASAVTLATSYAVGDVFGLHHSLHRPWREAKAFYALYAGMVVVAAGIVLIPHAPLGLITTAVQALAGILLPSATVFLLLLCNDRDVLGPWVNKAWVNVLATIIVGILVGLSLILAAATLFPSVDVTQMLVALSGVLAIGLLATGALTVWRGRPAGARAIPLQDRLNWRMPPLAELHRPVWSTTTKVGMITLRGYLLIAVLLMVVKVVQLATGR